MKKACNNDFIDPFEVGDNRVNLQKFQQVCVRLENEKELIPCNIGGLIIACREVFFTIKNVEEFIKQVKQYEFKSAIDVLCVLGMSQSKFYNRFFTEEQKLEVWEYLKKQKAARIIMEIMENIILMTDEDIDKYIFSEIL